MQETTSREKILKKIRKALSNKGTAEYGDVDFDSEIYTMSDEPNEITFAKNLSSLNGKFLFIEHEKDFGGTIKTLANENAWDNIFCFEPELKKLLDKSGVKYNGDEKEIIHADIGITYCECLVARTGTVMVSSRQASGRRLPFYSNIHVVVAYTSQLVNTVKDGIKLIRNRYSDPIPSMISAISGPSRTADIEKTLVQGAHGPKELYVCLIDDSLPGK